MVCVVELSDEIKAEKFDPEKKYPDNVVPCYDPATMDFLGTVPAMTPEQVQDTVEEAWTASKVHL